MTYDMFQTVAEYVHLNFSSEHDFRLRESSQAYCEKIVEFTKEHVDKIGQRISLPDTFNHIATGGHTGHDFLKKVFDKLGKRYSHREIAAHVFAATVPSAAVWSAAVTHVLDFFLQEEGKKEATEEEVKQEKANREMREAVAKLLESKEEGDKVKLQGYIREAIRQSHFSSISLSYGLTRCARYQATCTGRLPHGNARSGCWPRERPGLRGRLRQRRFCQPRFYRLWPYPLCSGHHPGRRQDRHCRLQ
jgi:hypothetical protein